MSTVKLDESKAAEIAAFYQAELQKVLARYTHIKSTLESLGESAPTLDLNVSTKVSSKSSRKRKSKPGPNSVWDKKILKRLKAMNKPVTYEELTDDIMALDGHPKEKRANIKASIINVTYRLRTRDRKINTFSMGTREKFIALKSWFDSDGNIKEVYSSRIKVVRKKKNDGPKRPVGRPPGSKNKKGTKPKGPSRPVGRPKGSKNRPGAKKPGPKKEVATAPVKKAPAKKKPAKKTAAKKTTLKKTPAKKSPTSKKSSAKKKAPAKKTVAKKAPAKKSPAKKTPAKKTVAKKAPAKKAAAKKTAAKGAKKSRGPLVIKNKQ